MTKTKHIILYDGTCGFCSYWVRFIRKRDKQDKFAFLSLQSDEASLLTGFNKIKEEAGDTVIYKHNNRYYYRSEAAIRILMNLGGIYRLSSVLLMIPQSIRDYFYNLLARYRHKWFTASKECSLESNI